MVLMDLSKAYDCLPHNLLIAKLDPYGVGADSVKLVFSYLTDRKQKVKAGYSFTTWKCLSKGVPQGFVLINIFINDFFYAIEHSQVCNFAGDDTTFACGETLNEVTKSIENDMGMAMNWFKLNEMVSNPEKFQIIFSGLKEDHKLSIGIDGDAVKKNLIQLSSWMLPLAPNLELTSMPRVSAKRLTIRLKLFQGLEGTWNPRRLAYYITRLY